ncbi:Serum paraoxonase/arylesterase 2 [Branchiostoma belcheri]|nr:Serum paraoxonase/arylesterase 2 [Branchiostoma belcheri]
MPRTVVLVLAVVSSAVVLNHVAKLLMATGMLKHVYNHVPGTCRFVPGAEQGSEDIALTSSGLAFISSGLVPAGFILDPAYFSFEQKILVFDFHNPAEGAKKVNIVPASVEEDFMPHGLSVYEDDSGEVRLFVVNHAKGQQDRVEIFRFDANSNSLHHIRSITHPLFYSLNDILAIGPESFYASNDKYSTGLYSRMAETWLLLPWSNVVYYTSGGEAIIVADGFVYANGISLSPEGKLVYVADFTNGVVNVYRRQDDNTLAFSRDISLHSSVHKIFVDPASGDLWIGAHPSAFQLAEHLKDASRPCGSQVLRVEDPAGENPKVTEMYSDDGRWLWGSSIACYHDKQLLIGTINHKLMLCTVDLPL